MPVDTGTITDILIDVQITTKPLGTIARERQVCFGTVFEVYTKIRARGVPIHERKVGRPRKDTVALYATEMGLSKDEFMAGLVRAWEKYRLDRTT